MAGVTATYDLPVLNAMLEVETFFQEMLCDAYGVEDEDELPGEIPDVDVVKFAELSDTAIHGIIERALAPHPFKKAGITIEGVIGAILNKLAEAKSKTKVQWPTQSDGAESKSEGKDDYDDDPKRQPMERSSSYKSVHLDDQAAEDDHEAKHKPIVTAHYDLKTMNRIQQINNKFNDDLVQRYGVDDEDDLPEAVMEITFGDVIVNDHWNTAQIKHKLEEAIRAEPWKNMNDDDLDGLLSKCMDELTPFVAKMSADGGDAKK